MDDLATTERSRWELWAEIAHGRVSTERFDHILSEELAFLKADKDSDTKRIQVRWQADAAIWYPIAAKILRNLVVTDEPVEFATQLMLPFTFDHVRSRHLGA